MIGIRVTKLLQLKVNKLIDDALEIDSVATEHTMDAAIQNLVEGKEISDEFKPSFGCSIKWVES